MTCTNPFRLNKFAVSLTVIGCFFLSVATVAGQGIKVTPAYPAASTGGQVTISADRPVKFSLFGYGKASSATATSISYQAPSTLSPQHLLNGCMVGPNDSVFNTTVTSLPVDPSSGAWTPYILANGASIGFKWGLNVVNNATPMAAQQFAATTQLNGVSFPVPPQTSQKRQNGAYTTDESVDHHMISLNTQTCQFYETNQQGIPLSECPTCTAESGWTYASTSYALPSSTAGGSADPSGLPLAPLTLHVSELRAGYVNHALRFTACAACVSPGARWPAVSSNGLQPSAPPVGTRFRLKSSFNISNFPAPAQRVLIALQRYGMILAGPGVDGEIAVSTDVTADPVIVQALQSLAGGALNSSNFEVVDESSYMLSPNSTAVNPLNGHQYPVNFALLTVTDAANRQNSVQVPIALQPVMAGTPEPSMVVQAGTPAFRIPSWVTGTTNQAVTWTVYPSTGGGTINSSGLYTPPSSVNNPTKITLALNSNANPTLYASTTVTVMVVPSGALRIDSGSTIATRDDRGQVWLQDLGFETGSYKTVSDVSAQNSWSTAYNHTIWQSYLQTAGDDIFYKFHVPNGSYSIQLMFGVGDCTGSFAGQSPEKGLIWGALNLQSQSSLGRTTWNFGTPIAFQCQSPETSSLLAQVTDGTLSVAVRATGGNGQHTAALLNGMTITRVSNTAAANPAFTQDSAASATPTFNIQEIDPTCGQAGHNCLTAFQEAFNLFAQTGGGTLTLPSGTFLLDFPDLAQNVVSAPWFSARSILAVPPNTTIQGHVDTSGAPDTMILWNNTSVPNFIFAKASHSTMRNLYLRFTGTTPSIFPYGDMVMLKALQYQTTYPHPDEICGGNFEMFAFAFVVDSDYTTFSNLIFDSATHDNNHIFGMAINLKAKGLITNGGGGLTTPANGNVIDHVQVYDTSGAFLIAGQNGVKMTNISGDRRGSGTVGAPGHLIYSTLTFQADPSGTILSEIQNTNVLIQNIAEGPNTYSNLNSGGTLAPKYINGGLIDNVTSQHPEGLIQTLFADENVTFSNMTWKSTYNLCEHVPSNCGWPVIYSTGVTGEIFHLQNLIFKNISLTSTVTPITALLRGDGITVDGFNIQTPPTFVPGQTAKAAVLSVKSTAGASITNYTFTPLLTSYNPQTEYNTSFMAWHASSNVNAKVTVLWPSNIPLPAGSAITSAGFQDFNSNNVAAASVVLK